MNKSNERLFPPWIWLVYAVLFAASIPWYLPDGASMYVLMGLPLWLLLCISAVLLTAVFTALVIARYWREDDGASFSDPPK